MMVLRGIVVAFLTALQFAPSTATLFECPEHFQDLGNTCFLHVTEPQTRESAFSTCLSHGASIVSILDKAKQYAVVESVLKKQELFVWTVSKQNADGFWVDDDGAPATPVWGGATSPPIDGTERCSIYHRYLNGIYTNNCDNKNTVICEAEKLPSPLSQFSQCPKNFKLTSPGRCLGFFSDKLNWGNAQIQTCRSHRSYLVTLTSFEDIKEVRRYLGKLNFEQGLGVWTDIDRRSGTKWTSQTKKTEFVLWSNENIHGDTKDCSVLLDSAYMASRRCDDTAFILCEAVPSRPIQLQSQIDAMQCTEGYYPSPQPGRCFKYINTRETRIQAQRRCQQEGGNLVSTKSFRARTILLEYIQHEHIEHPIWLDIVFNGSNWVSAANGGTFAYWKFGYPANPQRNNCTSFLTSGETIDSHCFEKKAVVCETTTECGRGYVLNRGKCYRYFHQYNLNKIEAASLCHNMNAKLPEIQDAEENNVIRQMLAPADASAWLRTDDKAQNATFTDWGEGEPNGGAVEKCTGLFSNGKWLDLTCNYRLPILCVKRLSNILPEVALPRVVQWSRAHIRLPYLPRMSLLGYHCGKGWQMAFDKCYRLFTDHRTYSDAENQCKNQFSFMADDPRGNTTLSAVIREMITEPTFLRNNVTICHGKCQYKAIEDTKQHFICQKSRYCPDPLGSYDDDDSVTKQTPSNYCAFHDYSSKTHRTLFDLTYTTSCNLHDTIRVTSVNNTETENLHHGPIPYDPRKFDCIRYHIPYRTCPKQWQNRDDGRPASSLTQLEPQTPMIDCYLFVNKKLSWQEAREECWSLGGHLPEYNSVAAGKLLKTYFPWIKSEGFWSGFTDTANEGHFVGSYSNLVNGLAEKLPPNTNENCLLLLSDRVADYPCSTPKYVICQTATRPPDGRLLGRFFYPYVRKNNYCPTEDLMKVNEQSKKCMQVIQQTLTYQDALETCRQKNLYLGTIENSLETTFVKALSRGADRLWVAPGCQLYWPSNQTFTKVGCYNAKVRASALCQTYDDFDFTYKPNRTLPEEKNRCMPGLSIRSLRRVPKPTPTGVGGAFQYYITATDQFKVAEMRCKNSGMSIPDRLGMHCLYDAMQVLRKTYGDFAGDRFGPYLKNPNNLFMNANGGEYSTDFSAKNKILCVDILYTSGRCTHTPLSSPNGIGPRFATTFGEATTMCNESGKSLPMVSKHSECVGDFIEDASKVPSNGDYGTTHGVWMQGSTGSYVKRQAGLPSASDTTLNYVLCIN